MGKNDTTWKPGQSGNPAGRPKKGETLTDILNERLDKEAFVNKVIELAQSGDRKAIELIWERVEGKVPDKIDKDERIEITFRDATTD